jgi:hypothetical protein
MVRAGRLLLCMVVATLGLFGEAQTTRAVDPGELADELHFRENFGFTTDPRYVADLMASTQAHVRWGAFLSAEEEAEMDRRGELEGAIAPLEARAERLDGFAGHWIDQRDGGVVTVAFTEEPAKHAEALRTLLPAGAELRLAQVDFSLAQLRKTEAAVAEDLDELWEMGVAIRVWGVDISENRVRIGVAGLDSDIADVLTDRYGRQILPFVADPEPTACTSRESCFGPPLRAGISGAPKGTTINNRCSIAFLVHAGSAVQWLTAGHCATTTGTTGCTNASPPAYCWFHAGNGSWGIGSIRATCWPQCLYSDAARGGNINSTYASNHVWLNYLGDMRSVSSSQALNADNEGDLTCLNARKSEGSYRCGYIEFIGSWTYPGGVYFNELRFATYAHKYGDSGGAVQSGPTSHSPPRVIAYGVHSGCTGSVSSTSNCSGFSMYSHIARINQELGVSVCTVANPCP